jgi:hypothetical protein
MSFEYAVCPHRGDAYSGVSTLADEYNNDVIAVTTDIHKGALGTEQSWISLDRDSAGCVKITGIKRSEDGGALIVRGANLSNKASDVTISTAWKSGKAALVNILEEEMTPLKSDKGRVSFSVKSKEIFTLRIEIEKERTAAKPAPTILEVPERREDFGGYETAYYVTEEDISSEKDRADALREKIEDPMWRRTALEAQLSVILSRHRKDEVKIRELGYGLNEARVHRRIHDYLNANFPADED